MVLANSCNRTPDDGVSGRPLSRYHYHYAVAAWFAFALIQYAFVRGGVVRRKSQRYVCDRFVDGNRFCECGRPPEGYDLTRGPWYCSASDLPINVQVREVG
jgi:hypothetical protein